MVNMKSLLSGILLLSFMLVQNSWAATHTNVYPFKVIKKIEIDRSVQDPQEIVNRLIDVIRDNLVETSNGYFEIISSDDSMDVKLPVDTIRFNPNMVNGQMESAAQIEVITEDDRQMMSDNGKYGVTLPWNISVFSTDDMLAQMMDMMSGKTDSSAPTKNFIMVTIINPLMISKVAYRNLNWNDNFLLNSHLRSVEKALDKNINIILKTQTDYKWADNYNPMYNGMLKITDKDVKEYPIEKFLPELRVSGVKKDKVTTAYTDHLREIYAYTITPGTELNTISEITKAFFIAMSEWKDPDQPFDLDLSAMNGPKIHFDNLDDAKAKIPGMLDEMYGSLWATNVASQPWNYKRRFSVDEYGNVDLVEMCSRYFGSMMTGMGFHHIPSQPCMLGFRQEGEDTFINMFSAGGTLRFAFKDVTMMMNMMNMPVQLYLFKFFPDFINNELAALINGALEASGATERFEIIKFSDKY